MLTSGCFYSTGPVFKVIVIGAMEGEQARLDLKLDEVRKRLPASIEVRGLLGRKGEKLEFHLP